jgi:tyrosyl-tRNA synthetase
MDAKMRLAEEIVSGFHGPDPARKAAENFQRVFRDRQAPTEVPVQKIPAGPPKKLITLLVDLKLAPSKSEAERLIKQGAVELNEARVDDPRADLDLTKPAQFLLRAGKKKFLRLIIEYFLSAEAKPPLLRIQSNNPLKWFSKKTSALSS